MDVGVAGCLPILFLFRIISHCKYCALLQLSLVSISLSLVRYTLATTYLQPQTDTRLAPVSLVH